MKGYGRIVFRMWDTVGYCIHSRSIDRHIACLSVPWLARCLSTCLRVGYGTKVSILHSEDQRSIWNTCTGSSREDNFDNFLAKGVAPARDLHCLCVLELSESRILRS